MKYIKGQGRELPILELTRRNLLTLLAKLEDPTSSQMVIDGDHMIAVRAVSDDAHYSTRAPGEVKREHVDKFSDLSWQDKVDEQAADAAREAADEGGRC